MADVRANIGANTQGAEGALKRVLDMLRNLRRESESFRGDIQITQPEEVAKLTRALQDALKTAREFSRVDFSRFNADLGRSVQQLQKNVQLYLQAQKSLNPAVQQRFTQFLAGGGNPLAPNFNQLFPTLQGPALQRQMEFYFKSVLRGTGMPMPQLHMGGGAAGGSPTGARDAGGDHETARLRRQSAREEHRYWTQFRRTAGGMAGQGANFLTQSAGVGSFGGFGALAVTGGILGVAAHGFNLARETAELKDRLFRQTEDTGVALDKLTENLDRAGDAFGQSTREVLQTAQTWARAAYQSDVRAIEQGYTGAAGFARAHGLDPGQTAATFGSLRHYGLGGGEKGEQQKFAMLIGQTIRDSGLKSAPDQVVNELREIASQMARTTGRGLSATETDAYLRFRTSVSQDPILKGAEGMAAIESLDAAFRGTGGLPQEVFWAEALSGAGVTDLVRQSIVRSRGIFTDLGASDIGGQGSALDAVMRHSRMRYGSLDPGTRNLALSQITGMSPDLSGKLYEAYYSQAEPGALGRTISRLEGRGFKFSDMREDALSQILDAETATPGALRDMMERYASDMASNPNKRPDAEADAQRLREAISSGGDAAQMRDLYQDIVAKHGMQSTPASEWREASKGLESVLTALGEELQPLITWVASLAKDIPELSQNVKELADAARQWLGGSSDAGSTGGRGPVTQRIVANKVDRFNSLTQEGVEQGYLTTDGQFTESAPRGFRKQYENARRDMEWWTGTGSALDQMVHEAEVKGHLDANGRPTASAPPEVRQWVRDAGAAAIKRSRNRARQLYPESYAADGSAIRSGSTPTTATGAPTPPPATTTGGAAANGEDLVPGTQAWKDYLLSLDRQHGFPDGTMLSLAMQESSNRNLGYHYPEDANGKRKSTAYGPFGILDSTAADPGYGVAPLQNRTPAEQARFAADYLAARTRASGGSLRDGLIKYGTGAASYAESVLKRVQSSGIADRAQALLKKAGNAVIGSAEAKPTGASGSFKADGLDIDYRGDPSFHYGKAATAKAEPFSGIVFHHTGARGAEADIDAMVRYGQTVDGARGGAFGYHFYVDRDGTIVQGAPLDKRTNHIKPGSPTGLSNSNAIGITLVGVDEKNPETKAQKEAALRLGKSLQQQFGISGERIKGHGELQSDRQAIEGVSMATRMNIVPIDQALQQIYETEIRDRQEQNALPTDLDGPDPNAYVPNLERYRALAGREPGGRFGELTLHIDQRVNGETRSRQTQRLRAGSGVDIPRMHGSVALVS